MSNLYLKYYLDFIHHGDLESPFHKNMPDTVLNEPVTTYLKLTTSLIQMLPNEFKHWISNESKSPRQLFVFTCC